MREPLYPHFHIYEIASNVRADWLEDLVWTDVRAFLEDPGEVLERLRSEEIDTDASSNELQIRRDALTRRLATKNTEKDRYVRAYAQGHISEEELADYVADIKNQTNNLRLLISSVEDDLASLTETREVAESAAEWLLTLRERASEVEDKTPEAFQKRRELVRLLVEKITTDRMRTVIREWRSPTDLARRLRSLLSHLCRTRGPERRSRPCAAPCWRRLAA